MADLWQRLKQRKMVQWTVAYLAVSWGLLQVLDLAASNFGWSTLLVRIGFGVAALGFVVTLVLAWYHGERGAQKVSGVELLILATLFTIGGGLLWKFTGDAQTSTPPPATALPKAAAKDSNIADGKSIAVLPFAVLSSGEDDALFADGLSEEIINSLSRVPDLQVAARSSSFAMRGSKLSAPEMAAKLHVAHVLEGSIRRAGDRLRITTQLIRAADGFNVWTENYDRSNQDIIAIQEDVARSIAQALKTVTDPKALAAMQRIGTRSVPAYDAYLKGLALRGKAFETGDYGYFAQALSSYDQATLLDPGFGRAHLGAVGLVGSSLNLTAFNAESMLRIPYATRMRNYKQRLDEASASSKDPALTNYFQSLRAWVDMRYADALRLTQAYLLANPESEDALGQAVDLARVLRDDARVREYIEREYALVGDASAASNAMTSMLRLPDLPRAVVMARDGLRRFPDNAGIIYQAQRVFLTTGSIQEAAGLVPVLMSSELDAPTKILVQMRQACAEGRRADAEAAFRQFDVNDPDPSNQWHGLLLLGRESDAVQWLSKFDQPEYLYGLSSFLTYNNFDASRFPNLRAVLERQGIRIRKPMPEPYACKAEEGSP